jgi:CheY-like chemotaxis protein
MGRILVVDDEAGVRSFLAESLELGGMLPSPEVDTVPLA